MCYSNEKLNEKQLSEVLEGAVTVFEKVVIKCGYIIYSFIHCIFVMFENTFKVDGINISLFNQTLPFRIFLNSGFRSLCLFYKKSEKRFFEQAKYFIWFIYFHRIMNLIKNKNCISISILLQALFSSVPTLMNLMDLFALTFNFLKDFPMNKKTIFCLFSNIELEKVFVLLFFFYYFQFLYWR